jgi:hypothetical protein
MAIIAESREKRIAGLLLERAVAVDRVRAAEARVAQLEATLLHIMAEMVEQVHRAEMEADANLSRPPRPAWRSWRRG